MAGVSLPAAVLGFVLTLSLAAGPEVGATEAGQPTRSCALAAPILSRTQQDAAAAQTDIEDCAAERIAEAEREEAARRDAERESAGKAAIESHAQTRPESAEPKPQAPAKRTIAVGGATVSYVDAQGASEAPACGAGLWKGSDSTTDGSFAYFIGHNPGSFSAVARLGVDSSVTVVDSDGNARTYTVRDAFTVPRDATWGAISERVSGYGESVILQTCVEGGYKVLVAN